MLAVDSPTPQIKKQSSSIDGVSSEFRLDAPVDNLEPLRRRTVSDMVFWSPHDAALREGSTTRCTAMVGGIFDIRYADRPACPTHIERL